MGDALFDQAEADRQVLISMNQKIINMLKELGNMSLLQLADGSVVRVDGYKVVSVEELQEMIAKAQAHLSELQSFTQPTPPTAPADPGQPVAAPAAPVDPTQPPADPNAVPQPAPVDQAQVVPAPEVTAVPDPAVPPLQ